MSVSTIDNEYKYGVNDFKLLWQFSFKQKQKNEFNTNAKIRG